MLKQVNRNLQAAQNRMTQIANNRHNERSFSIGDYVYLKLQHYRQKSVVHRSSQKLSAKFFDPYLVINKIGNVVHKLELPPSSTIHLVFHVSQLKRHVGSQPVQTTLPQMPPNPVLQPQATMDRRIVKRKNQTATQILIHWRGFSPADATWEYAEEIATRFPHFNLDNKVNSMGEDLSHVVTDETIGDEDEGQTIIGTGGI